MTFKTSSVSITYAKSQSNDQPPAQGCFFCSRCGTATRYLPFKIFKCPPPNPAWTRGACWWICRPMGDWGHIIIVLKRSSSPRGRTRRCRTVAMQRAQVEFLLAAVVCQHHRTHSECGSCLEDVCAFQHVGHIRSSDSNREAVWSLKVTLVWL